MQIGVIGAGIMGFNHARVLADLPQVTLKGIVDPDSKLLKKHTTALKTQGSEVVGFETVDQLIAAGIDAAIVAAPTGLHFEIGMKLINAGIHVLIEKPIASTVLEGETLVKAARDKGVTLCVGHVERFNPAVTALAKAIEGENILSVHITRVGPFPPRMSNVGVVIDLAVHDIDLITSLTKSKISEVQPQISKTQSDIREDIALLQFRTESGVLAHINTNWLTPFKARNIEIATAKKYVIADLLTRQVSEYSDYKPDGSYTMRHLSVTYTEPLRAELINFINAIKTGTAPEVTGEQGVAALAVAIKCLEK
jgi:UDP-N-acetylglucosamine 3-dehydrogenase